MSDPLPALEPEPAAAAAVFGTHLDRARQFTANLASEGEKRGLIGPLEVPRLWSRHILNSAVAAPAFAGSVADVGSGAGLPGLVLALARPDVEWTLIEPMERRIAWLTEQVAELDLRNVTVVRARAEDVSPTGAFDMVTARAVSALRTLIPLTAPLVRRGGTFAFLKGASIDREIEAATAVLRKYGVREPRVELFGAGLVAEPTRVFLGDVDARR